MSKKAANNSANDAASPPSGDSAMNAGPANQREAIAFWVTIAGTIITTVSLILAAYFYQAAKIRPRLTFGVHPLKTELQRPEADGDLGFTYGGKPIDSTSITSVQVSLWNAGNRSIRDTDILQPVSLLMPDGSAILRARIKKASRPICGFECVNDASDYKAGRCRLRWRILEPDDGVVLQVIYAGSARENPKVEGAIEGQKDGIAVEQYGLTATGKPTATLVITRMKLGILIFLVIVAVSLMLIANAIDAKSAAWKRFAEAKSAAEKQLAELRKEMAKSRKTPVWFLVGGVLALVVLILVIMLTSVSPDPPFGW